MSHISSRDASDALLVRDDRGEYRAATADEVLAHARQVMARRVRRGTTLSSPQVARDYLRLQLGDREHEVFAMLLLDSQHRLIEFVELFRGTIDGAAVYPREVVKEALARNAAAVVDVAGQAGLEDAVDWHWDRIFAGTALSTLIGIGAELAAPDRDDGRIVVAGRDSVQETVNEAGQQITRRNLNLQPTLTIRPGFPVRVIVNRDLVLRPYAG